MRSLRLLRVLLQPSLASATTCLSVALAGLAIMDWAFLTHSPLLYNYFFGPDGLVTELQQSPTNLSGLWHGIFTDHFSRAALTYLFILLIAVVIFSLLEVLVHVAGGVRTSMQEAAQMPKQFGPGVLLETTRRLLLRLGVVVVWFGYGVLFVKVIVPFSVATSRYGIATITQHHQGWYVALGAGLLVVALHLHVVFTRLLLLRLRVFGGVEALLAAEQNH
ncbi:MAG TPA: hypothetical protein VLF91_04370 [Candidatus Saccharimonadales bacterium]|nr:hypothetical protein [Candidatus Saccharimonadales bacterium]